MMSRQGMLVEFLVVAALGLAAIVGLVALTIAHMGESSAASTLEDVIKTILGALIALAYAARGVFRNGKPPDGS